MSWMIESCRHFVRRRLLDTSHIFEGKFKSQNKAVLDAVATNYCVSLLPSDITVRSTFFVSTALYSPLTSPFLPSSSSLSPFTFHFYSTIPPSFPPNATQSKRPLHRMGQTCRAYDSASIPPSRAFDCQPPRRSTGPTKQTSHIRHSA